MQMIIVFSISFFLVTFSILGQKTRPIKDQSSIPPCTLMLKDSPNVRGLRLRMTEREFLEVVPGAVKDQSTSLANREVGEETYDLPVAAWDAPIEYEARFVQFVDGRLSFVSIVYPNFEPTSANDFARQAAEKLGLPIKGWRSSGTESRILDCAEFSVEVWTGKEGFKQEHPHLLLRDKVATAIIAQRIERKKQLETERRRQEQRERRVFKP